MAIAFLFYFLGLQSTNASIFFPLVQTQPLFAVVLSSIFLNQLEIISRWTALGSLIIVSGAALVVIG
jgi:drug/metabolite transporter (DMT)-like permease